MSGIAKRTVMARDPARRLRTTGAVAVAVAVSGIGAAIVAGQLDAGRPAAPRAAVLSPAAVRSIAPQAHSTAQPAHPQTLPAHQARPARARPAQPTAPATAAGSAVQAAVDGTAQLARDIAGTSRSGLLLGPLQSAAARSAAARSAAARAATVPLVLTAADHRLCPAAATACVDLTRHITWLQAKGKVAFGPVQMEPGQPGSAHQTPRGTFHVSWKAGPNYISATYHEAMPWATFFAAGGIAFHAGSLTQWSHGCVHLTVGNAHYYQEHLPIGAEVVVF